MTPLADPKRHDGHAVASVSVVIPCYECAETIERAVASVSAQTLRPSEVILVDDASSDDTLHVLKRVQAAHPDGWIKIVPLAINGGPSRARNMGWAMAQEAYVAFLDADDSWHPKKVECQYGWMVDHPEVSLTGHPWRAAPEVAVDYFDCSACEVRQVSPNALLFSNKFCTSGVMIRRDIAVRFDETKSHSEDYLLWLEIGFSGGLLYLMDLPLAVHYKEAFGEAGLSKNLLKMQRGQLDTYAKIRRKACLPFHLYVLIWLWSHARFARRVLIHGKRKASKLAVRRQAAASKDRL